MEIKVDPRIVKALNSSSMISSKVNIYFIHIAQRGRSHLLLRDQEEEKAVKGIKKIADKNKKKYIEMWNENEYLKSEIEKIEEELERRKNDGEENKRNRGLLSDLYERGIIDEDGNIIK